jgi:hypothetical protein
VVKAAARRNDAEAVKMVSGFVFRDFGCEQRRLAAVSRWHIVAVADQLSEAMVSSSVRVALRSTY